MPVHDWTRVAAGIFHHFHQAWVMSISTALNDGILPPGYYALSEQIAGRLGPDILALERPVPPTKVPFDHNGTLTLEAAPPRTKFRLRTDEENYAKKANRVAIRHVSDHRVIALVEVVSPGNKDSKHGLQAFLRKTEEALEGGVHLLILDLFPPGPRDPEGLHPLIQDGRSTPVESGGEAFRFDPVEPLSLMAYVASSGREAFIQPIAVGDELPTMPLFLTEEEYVRAPLASSYETAWRALPAFWRNALV